LSGEKSVWIALPKAYNGVRNNLRVYFDAYGGWKEICVSPYLHAATVLAILTPGIWTRQGWWDIPLGVLPNVIGFTLGGYAILIAFGDERFKTLLTTPSDEHPVSAFLAINATFVHFLLIQIGALLLAITAKSRPFSYFEEMTEVGKWLGQYVLLRRSIAYTSWFLGYVVFLYALTLAFAATAAVFRVARWFELAKRLGKEDKEL